MTDIELEALESKLSNLARVLYCLYLRPQIKLGQSSAKVNNKSILNLLNKHETVIERGRQINQLFEQLMQIGLIESSDTIDFTKSLNKHTFTLPLMALPQSLEDPTLHGNYSSMHLRWRPLVNVFEDLCSLIGLIEKTYSAEELGEFIAYWLGRTETQCSEYTWTQKLVIHLKQRRQRLPLSQQKTAAGHQYVTPAAGIAFDENVKHLIDQYRDEI